MPHVALTDEAKLGVMTDIQLKSSIDIGFFNREGERNNIRKDMIELDWQLTIAAGSEKPRYIILEFQELSEKQRTFNGA